MLFVALMGGRGPAVASVPEEIASITDAARLLQAAELATGARFTADVREALSTLIKCTIA